MSTADVLAALLKTNLALAGAVVLVLAFRLPARRAFGARIAYSLWVAPLLAAAAVLLPPRVRTAVEAFAETGPFMAAPDFDVAAPPLAAAPTLEAASLLTPAQGLLLLWLFGVAIALAAVIVRQRRFVKIARQGATGPAVIGVLIPRIIEPADFAERFTLQEQALVMEHERAHIARQDSRANGLLALIQCLCWFNPLVHLGGQLMRIDQELACDEAVITRFPHARSAYAGALLKTQLVNRPLPLGCYWPSVKEHPLLERIAMLKRNLPTLRRKLTGGAGVLCLSAFMGVAAWAAMPARVIIEAPAPEVTQTLPAAGAPVNPAIADYEAAQAAQLETPPPGEVCLTNACGGVAVDLTGQTQAKSVQEAIALGNAGQVRALGGTVPQVAEAVARRFEARLAAATPETLEGVTTVANNFARFFSTANGATLEFSDDTSGQAMAGSRTVVGSIVRRGDPDGRTKIIWMLSDGNVMGQIPPGQIPIGNGLAINPPEGYVGPITGIPIPISPLQTHQSTEPVVFVGGAGAPAGVVPAMTCIVMPTSRQLECRSGGELVPVPESLTEALRAAGQIPNAGNSPPVVITSPLTNSVIREGDGREP